MKKLIIAAAVVCAAVMAQAATANWKVSAANVKDGTGTTTGYSGAGYVFDAEVTSQAALFALFAADTATFDATKQSGYAGSVTVSSGAVNANLAANQFGYGDQTTSGSSVYHDFYLAIVDGDKMYLSLTKENVLASGTDAANAIAFGNQNPTTGAKSSTLPTDGFVAAGQWAKASTPGPSPIPEPTSGLLVLLGVAGLALRRRA